MPLIKSISGIRGTIGGLTGEGLDPLNIVRFAAAFAAAVREKHGSNSVKIMIGRDARISGDMVSRLVSGTLVGMGVDVIDAGVTTTPTLEMAIPASGSTGGIMITASHNPRQWNALKLMNSDGEFVDEREGMHILDLAGKLDFAFSEADKLGKVETQDSWLDYHIDRILSLDLVDREAIRKAGFRVAADGINSSGIVAVPRLLQALGVEHIDLVSDVMDGQFIHNPEPLPENLGEISRLVVKNKAHVGFAVDPDVDRLAVICEDGEMFGEEYTLVAVADYVLSMKPGNTVSNLSSTRALRDITEKAGAIHFASAVGEVNVVKMMKDRAALIGGEGNGGVIFPELHYGRDALLGIALFLSHLARSGKRCSALRHTYPNYFIAKNKLSLSPEIDLEDIFQKIGAKYSKQPNTTIDGLRIEFGQEWVHLRKSNTEPIIRIYAESDLQTKAEHLAQKIIDDIREVIQDQMMKNHNSH